MHLKDLQPLYPATQCDTMPDQMQYLPDPRWQAALAALPGVMREFDIRPRQYEPKSSAQVRINAAAALAFAVADAMLVHLARREVM